MNSLNGASGFSTKNFRLSVSSPPGDEPFFFSLCFRIGSSLFGDFGNRAGGEKTSLSLSALESAFGMLFFFNLRRLTRTDFLLSTTERRKTIKARSFILLSMRDSQLIFALEELKRIQKRRNECDYESFNKTVSGLPLCTELIQPTNILGKDKHDSIILHQPC